MSLYPEMDFFLLYLDAIHTSNDAMNIYLLCYMFVKVKRLFVGKFSWAAHDMRLRNREHARLCALFPARFNSHTHLNVKIYIVMPIDRLVGWTLGAKDIRFFVAGATPGCRSEEREGFPLHATSRTKLVLESLYIYTLISAVRYFMYEIGLMRE